MFDAWGLKDHGLDNLGRGRRAVPLAEEYRGRVHWQHRHYLPDGFQLTGEVGLITEVVDRHTPADNPALEGYLCGSAGMIDASCKVLAAKGLGEDRIFYDKFN